MSIRISYALLQIILYVCRTREIKRGMLGSFSQFQARIKKAARNYLMSTSSCTVMQMSNVICEKGY